MRNSSVRARARRRLISSSSVVRQLCGDGTAISGDAWFGIWWDDRAWSARVKAELSQVIHGLFTLGARPLACRGVGFICQGVLTFHATVAESEAAAASTWASCPRRRVTVFFQSVPQRTDRKSTRLNSSHLGIPYAGLCLEKKTKKTIVMKPTSTTRGSGHQYLVH